MTRTYKIEGLDCASCGNDLESRLVKLKGIKHVRVNFLMRKISIQTEDVNQEKTFTAAEKIMKRYGVKYTISESA